MKKFKRSAQSQPKHGKPASSGASKAPVAPPVRRPGWTGPSYLHKPAKKTPTPVKETSSIEQIQSLSVRHQQLILDTIRTSFPAVDEFDTLKPVLREIREALEQKDYCKAFGSEEFLEAYTIRWSPSRALTIGNVLAWMCSEMNEAAWVQQFLHNEKPSKIACFGRGGSDLLACVVLLKHSHESKLDGLPRLESSDHNDSVMVDLNLIDRHDWSDIVAKLQHTLTNPPPLSKYATEKARASNISAIPSQVINLTVNNLDILESDSTTLRAMIGSNPALITLFFTLHEFYSISISKTTAFLLRLTETAPKGSLLLVVDSLGAEVVLPGSSDKGEEKRYPLEWLLYQALLPPKSANSEAQGEPVWRKLIDSGHEKEYKLPTGLRYPGSLENTRFQVHLLERL
jgi:25S rRNA (uracil2843-N3)-methyltransferase